MRKIVIILTLIILSACAQAREVETCHYSIIISSFLPEASQEVCELAYDAINSAKFNRKLVDEVSKDIFSVHIRFRFIDGEEESYIIDNNGSITYQENEMFYKIKIDKEIVDLLKENIKSQKN